PPRPHTLSLHDALPISLSRGGSKAQKGEYLPKIADGSTIGSLAVDEGGKHRPHTITLKASRSGNGFKLKGAKAFVVDGHVANLLDRKSTRLNSSHSQIS